MLIHIVCWKYKPETDAETRDLHRNRLAALAAVVDAIHTFDVGADILHLDRSFDTGLVVRFRDREALDRYTDHPEHLKVAAMGKDISEKVVSVDFFTHD
ncbi:Dabb family protein [soil metagenome]